jgi:hypothetical protein
MIVQERKVYICEVCGEEFSRISDCVYHESICKINRENKLNELKKLVDDAEELLSLLDLGGIYIVRGM